MPGSIPGPQYPDLGRMQKLEPPRCPKLGIIPKWLTYCVYAVQGPVKVLVVLLVVLPDLTASTPTEKGRNK